MQRRAAQRRRHRRHAVRGGERADRHPRVRCARQRGQQVAAVLDHQDATLALERPDEERHRHVHHALEVAARRGAQALGDAVEGGERRELAAEHPVPLDLVRLLHVLQRVAARRTVEVEHGVEVLVRHLARVPDEEDVEVVAPERA